MFTHYYDLKDDNNLPPNSFFKDPLDDTKYITSPKESLDQFINKIQTSRAEKGLPQFFHKDIRELVVAILAEAAPQHILQQYFVQKSMMAQTSQLIGVAKTIASQYLKNGHASYNLRQERAAKCLGCKLHKTTGGFSSTAVNMVNKLAGLDEVVQSAKEKQLGTCTMCGCGMQSKIRFPILSVIAGIIPEDLRKLLSLYGPLGFEKCWVLNETTKESKLRVLLEAKLRVLGAQASSYLTAYLTEKQQRALQGSNITLQTS